MIRPHQVARAMVTFYGSAPHAVGTALGMKAKHPPHSDRAVFFDQVAREIERGLFMPKQGAS